MTSRSASRVLAVAALAGLSLSGTAHADSFAGLGVSLTGTASLPTSGLYAGQLLLTPSTSSAVGAAWLSAPVATAAPFLTTFSFNLSNVGGLGNADGVALVFQNIGTGALGSSGGSLGVDLPDNATPGGSVAAELQTFWQTYGIVRNTDANGGPFSNSLALALASGDSLSQADLIVGTETVSYDPATHTLSQAIGLNYTLSGITTPIQVTTSTNVDLAGLFGATVTVGLSAATGGGTTDQTITAWTVSSVPEPASWRFLAAGLLGIGAWFRRFSR